MKFTVHPVTPFQQNCSLAWCETTGQAVLVDPGGDPERLVEAARHQGVTPVKILLTHGHLDHVGAAHVLSEIWDIPILGPHEEDAFLLDNLPEQAEMFGFPPIPAFHPHAWLRGGDRVEFGEVHLDVLHCPGHTPGHVVFFAPETRLAFVGDVLFRGSIGRTDFPRGNHRDLLNAIRRVLFPLGDDVGFVPGHGPMSTFGHERQTNPFVGDGAQPFP